MLYRLLHVRRVCIRPGWIDDWTAWLDKDEDDERDLVNQFHLFGGDDNPWKTRQGHRAETIPVGFSTVRARYKTSLSWIASHGNRVPFVRLKNP